MKSGRKNLCFIHKGLNKNGFVSKSGKGDMMRWVSIEIEISSKTEQKKIVPTSPQSMHGQEGGKFNKEKTIKMNLMHTHFIHSRTSHSIHTLHWIYFLI